ncbi:hypothetical protein Psta_1018 [Pirellula staleyi DSM 6068]|uniref:Uncharacterized protein n=1 Tax=Pirellula staleyi (strain ATCC 27377 / DSM 6068 / ICPB 4128) TaxID=530564 RepID=D2R885_PIRSD|nr:hypothetical protein [Pirellula staleyi]ADB15702.1 hypothetical protein Psta_1018 [Pirellula staleyi DSM 6068]
MPSTSSRAPLKRAPAAKQPVASPAPSPDDYVRWREHLGARKTPKLPAAVAAQGKLLPLLALGTHTQLSDAGRTLAEQLSKVAAGGKPSPTLTGALTAFATGITPPMKPAEWGVLAIAITQALPRLATLLPGETWCQLADEILREAREGKYPPDPSDDPLAWLLLRVELPLTMSALFPEFETSRETLAQIRTLVEKTLEEVVDEQGLLCAAAHRDFGGTLAALLRIRALETLLDSPILTDAHLSSLRAMLMNFMRLLHSKDQLALVTSAGSWSVTKEDRLLVKQGLALFPKAQRAVLEELLEASGSAKAKTSTSALPPPANYSESAGVAILRSSWQAPRTQVTVTFVDATCTLEVLAAGEPVFSGDWPLEVKLDGAAIAPSDSWEEVLWHSDADVDYLEIEIALEGGVRLQRQILLSRKDHALLLAEAVLGEEVFAKEATHKLAINTVLPLAQEVHLATERETRDARLSRENKSLASVLPLSLAEWRAELSPGEMIERRTAGSDGPSLLVHSQAIEGRNLYAPLFIDLHPARRNMPVTWRRLTVAENLTIVRRDAATGYRAQVGPWQWLVYRSLGIQANRTLLGQNYATEFVCCRFCPNGSTEDILEVQ